MWRIREKKELNVKFNRGIFREYDIRGIFETDLKGKFSHDLGRAFGRYVVKAGMKKVCVGGDNRITSPELREKLIEGLAKTGCEVTDIGTVPTPALYFAVHRYRSDGGVMVTASHNPPEYNGFKMVFGGGSLHGKEIQRLADYMESGNGNDGKGHVVQRDILDEYISFMTGKFSFKKKFRIGVDTGNGTLGPTLLKVLKPLGIEVLPLYTESDPSFPNHLPDPLVADNLRDLIKAVLENKLDAGFAYDGDGDRLGVIDNKGNIWWGDKLMILYAREVLANLPGSSVIFDVKCTRALEEEIRKAGGKPLMWKTGHSLIEDKLHSEKAPIAGELSGHLYFADEYYGYDDAVYASLRLLRIMDNKNIPLSEMLKGVKEYSATPEIRIEVPDEKKFGAVERIKNFFRQDYTISDIDGVKVYFPEGWALARASNTQPAIVVRIEAETQASLETIKRLFISKISEIIQSGN